MYFVYGDKEIEHLKCKDKLLGEAILQIGHINRSIDNDLFSSIVNNIVGQQISNGALKTVWGRMVDFLGEITVERIAKSTVDELQKQGMTFRKAAYIKGFADVVLSGEFDIEALKRKSDAEVIKELSALKGIGVWTAEMIMIFCLQRPDILSFGDLAIHRGMRMLYHHKNIDKKLFEKYRRRYSPHGSVASLYLWAISAGEIGGMRDYQHGKK